MCLNTINTSLLGNHFLNRVLSPSIQQLDGSKVEEEMRSAFLGWMEGTLGARHRCKKWTNWSSVKCAGLASMRRPEAALPTVYPDRDTGLRPRLPEVSDVSETDRKLLRAWLRNFFNYLWSRLTTLPLKCRHTFNL
jgi:hypothetical protein